MERAAPVYLQGIVIPVEWDNCGNHTAIALSADDEREYRISPGNQHGRAMMKLLQFRVGLEGFQKKENGAAWNNLIEVIGYQIIEDDQD